MLFALLIPLLAFPAASPDAARKAPDAPRAKDSTAVSQTTLPMFTPEGNRSMLLRGSAMDIQDSGRRFQMSEMYLTVYAGDPEGTIESILVAPEATFLLNEEVASGEKSVRYLSVRDGIDATAMRWSYTRKEKSISLSGNVKVVFQAELKDLLK